MAQVIVADSSPSRFLFEVTGPQAVDLATLWLSPDGAALCSGWGHTKNVARLSMAGQDSTCLHAEAFKKAINDLAEHRAALYQYLGVAGGTQPYAEDIATFRGAAAAAFDGVILSPVVATRRHLLKCVTVGCRSTQRRCHHASLVWMLDRLVGGRGDDGDSSDESSDSDDSAREDEEDERVIEEELVIISRDRQKRNLVACTDEDRQALLWARTAELATVDVPAAPLFSPPPVGVDGQQAPATKPVTLVGRMAELGLA